MKNNFTTVIYKDKKYIVANVLFVFDFEYLNKIDKKLLLPKEKQVKDGKNLGGKNKADGKFKNETIMLK